jgi:AraC-like DNA-binding protein
MLLSIMLLGIKNGNNTANRYLAGFLFISSLYCLGNYCILFGNSIPLVAVFITCIPSFYYLIGPLAFLYVRSIVKDNSKLSTLDYLHFLLFIIIFSGSLPFLFTSWEYKLKVADSFVNGIFFNTKIQTNFLIPKKVNHLLRPLQTLVYTVLNWRILFIHKNKKSSYSNKIQFKLIYSWLFAFNCLLTIAAFAYLVGLYNMLTIQSKFLYIGNSRIILLILILSYSVINLCFFIFPKIMYGLPLERLNSINPIAPEQISTTEQFDSIANGNKFEVSSSSTIQSPLFLFNKEYCDELQFQLEKCINELWFIDTNFKLDSLSKNSGIPLHHWTYYFNEIKKQNFIDWKNSIRIDYAKKMIEEGFLENQTFLSLAALCGYNAKSTFIRAFKIHTGMNPSEFTKTSTS